MVYLPHFHIFKLLIYIFNLDNAKEKPLFGTPTLHKLPRINSKEKMFDGRNCSVLVGWQQSAPCTSCSLLCCQIKMRHVVQNPAGKRQCQISVLNLEGHRGCQKSVASSCQEAAFWCFVMFVPQWVKDYLHRFVHKNDIWRGYNGLRAAV